MKMGRRLRAFLRGAANAFDFRGGYELNNTRALLAYLKSRSSFEEIGRDAAQVLVDGVRVAENTLSRHGTGKRQEQARTQ